MGKAESRNYFFVLVGIILVVAVGASLLQEKQNSVTERQTFKEYNLQSTENRENPAQEVTGLAITPSSTVPITCSDQVPLGNVWGTGGIGWSDIDGSNVVYSKYDFSTQTEDVFIHNFGPDKTPNTADDQVNQITSNGPQVYVRSLKIAERYVVYDTYTFNGNSYDAYFFDIGPTGAVGNQSIGPISLYTGQDWIKSINVKNNVVSYIQGPPPTYQGQIFYCFADDTNRQAGTGCYAGASGIIQWTLQNAPSSYYSINNGFALGDASNLLFVYTLSTWQSGVSSEDIWIKDVQGERVLLRSINSDLLADAWLPVTGGWPLFITYFEENYCKVEESKRSHTSTPMFAAIQQNSVNKYSFNQRSNSLYFVPNYAMKLPQRLGPFKGVPVVWSDIKPDSRWPIVQVAESGNANAFSLQGTDPSISGDGYLTFHKYGRLMITFCKSV